MRCVLVLNGVISCACVYVLPSPPPRDPRTNLTSCTLPYTILFCRVESGAPGAAGAGFTGMGDPTGFAESALPPAPGLGGVAGGGGGAGVGDGHFPMTTYTTFETGALAKVEGKIRELDSAMVVGDQVRERRGEGEGGGREGKTGSICHEPPLR